MIAEWSDEYKTGFKLIDNDHKGLFKALNDLDYRIKNLKDNSLSDISDDLNFLARYVHEHFDREEALMREYEYPEFHQHSLSHRKIRRTVFAIRKLFLEKPELIDPSRLTAFFASWLKKHILTEDMAYGPFLKKNYGRRKTDLAPSISEQRLRLETRASEPQGKTVSVTLSVPEESKEIIERCAVLLRSGGSEAVDLAQFVDPMFGMTTEEVMKYAAIVLKRPQR